MSDDYIISRVYIIGAGFSAPMGYPVGRDLLPTVAEATIAALETDRLRISAFLRTLGEFVARLTGDPAPDTSTKRHRWIVDALHQMDPQYFYSVASVLSTSPHLLSWQNNDAVSVMSPDEFAGALAAATRTCLFDIGDAEKESKQGRDMRSLAKSITDPRVLDRHAIISFNWDEELDCILCNGRGNIAYTRGHEWQTELRVLLLKPHGSISWYDLGEGLLGNKAPFFISGDQEEDAKKRSRIVGYFDYEMPRAPNRSKYKFLERPPVITPPTFVKTFRYNEQQVIWEDAIRTLSEATEFVFLGYSLPPDDFMTRAAIRSALARRTKENPIRCVVIDRSVASLGNFHDMFADRAAIRYLRRTFGQSKLDLVAEIDEAMKGMPGTASKKRRTKGG
ncbi:MAG: hypothetical protein FJX57_02890 [Alphaproteobacteria bacterium]|nr:hypothetical protein [Alphaproteobacteria bacterium]